MINPGSYASYFLEVRDKLLVAADSRWDPRVVDLEDGSRGGPLHTGDVLWRCAVLESELRSVPWLMGKEWELPWEPVMELRKGKALGRRSAQRLALLWAEESDEE